jgi:hypothetical protein
MQLVKVLRRARDLLAEPRVRHFLPRRDRVYQAIWSDSTIYEVDQRYI